MSFHFRTYSVDSSKIKEKACHGIWQWSQSTVLKLIIAPSNTVISVMGTAVIVNGSRIKKSFFSP